MTEQELNKFEEKMNEMMRIICESFIPEQLPQGEYVVESGERAYQVGGLITWD